MLKSPAPYGILKVPNLTETGAAMAPVPAGRDMTAEQTQPGAPEQWAHINGKLIPKSGASVSIYDHGFLYGDGAFEGIRVYSGNIFRLEPHLARLVPFRESAWF